MRVNKIVTLARALAELGCVEEVTLADGTRLRLRCPAHPGLPERIEAESDENPPTVFEEQEALRREAEEEWLERLRATATGTKEAPEETVDQSLFGSES